MSVYDASISVVKVKTDMPKIYETVGFDVWEIKDPMVLHGSCDPLELINCRKIRKQVKRLLDSLLRLIMVIDKAKLATEIDTIDKAFANFSKINLEEVVIKEKEVKSVKKSVKAKSSIVVNDENQ